MLRTVGDVVAVKVDVSTYFDDGLLDREGHRFDDNVLVSFWSAVLSCRCPPRLRTLLGAATGCPVHCYKIWHTLRCRDIDVRCVDIILVAAQGAGLQI